MVVLFRRSVPSSWSIKANLLEKKNRVDNRKNKQYKTEHL